MFAYRIAKYGVIGVKSLTNSMELVNFELSGVPVTFETNIGEYAQYIKKYFSLYLISTKAKCSKGVHSTVLFSNDKVNLRDYLEIEGVSDSVEQIGSSMYREVKTNRIITSVKTMLKRRVIIDIKIDKSVVICKMLIRGKGIRDWVNFNLLGKDLYSLFYELTFPSIYYPYFFYEELLSDRFPLHSALFSYKEEGVLLCGLEGVGKTSVSFLLSGMGGGLMFSDNLSLVSANDAKGCFELLRLHDALPGLTDRYEKVHSFKAKKVYFAPKKGVSSKPVVPSVIIFPVFSDKTFFREMSVSEAVSMAISTSYLPSELKRYMDFRCYLNLAAENINSWKQQCESLEKLFSKSSCYYVGMNKENGLNDNINYLVSLIEGKA